MKREIIIIVGILSYFIFNPICASSAASLEQARQACITASSSKKAHKCSEYKRLLHGQKSSTGEASISLEQEKAKCLNAPWSRRAAACYYYKKLLKEQKAAEAARKIEEAAAQAKQKVKEAELAVKKSTVVPYIKK